MSSWPVVQVWDGQIKGSREAEQQPGLPHGSLMRETVRAVGGDGLAGLRCNGDAGPAIDGSRVADESDRAAAGVKNVPVLANDVIGHGDRAGSRDVHPRVRRFQDVGRGLGRKERCYGVVAAVKMDGLATVNEVGTYKAIVRARAGSIGGAVDCGRRTVAYVVPGDGVPVNLLEFDPDAADSIAIDVISTDRHPGWATYTAGISDQDPIVLIVFDVVPEISKPPFTPLAGLLVTIVIPCPHPDTTPPCKELAAPSRSKPVPVGDDALPSIFVPTNDHPLA